MKAAYRIVTKTRYGMLRIGLLFWMFTMEYWFILGENFRSDLFQGIWSEELFRFLCSYSGFILLHVLFGFRTHSRKVYLRYEFALSLMIKCAVVDAIFACLFAATGFYVNSIYFLSNMLLLLFYNEISILAVLVFINFVTKLCNQKQEKILYVGAEDTVSETKLEGYDAVYLFDIPAQERNDWLKMCYEKDITVYTTAKLSDILIRTSGIAQDGDKPVFYCTKFGIAAGTAVLKRGFDIAASCLGILVLWPVMAGAAAAIKIEDGGPVFYSQIRCTKDLKEFRIYKFRSMKAGCEDETGAVLSSKDDERVTRAGRFLRRWKIDELPQLFNIIKGEMSVVGPRPERPELIAENCQMVPEFVLRTKVKAGLTGYAQIRGEYETDKLDKLKWDLMYIENYSFLLDIKIIIITAINLLKGK